MTAPDIFRTILQWPKQAIRQTDHRTVRDAVMRPHVQFYNPDALLYPDTQGPIVPGDGGQITAGCAMVAYDDKPIWDRGNAGAAGPVKAFFYNQQRDTRVKQV